MYERKLRHKEEKSKKTLKGTAKRAAMEVMQFLID